MSRKSLFKVKQLFFLLLSAIFIFTGLYCVSGAESNFVAKPLDSSTNGIMGQEYSLAQAQEDYNQFRKLILYEILPKPFSNQEEIIQLFKNQAQLLYNNMTELEFYRVLNPIVVKLHCGHTVLRLSKSYKQFLSQKGNYLPIAVKVINQKAYVWHDFGNNIPRASEIVTINERPINQIISKLLDNITADGSNLTFKYSRLNQAFNWYYFNFIDCSDRFRLTFRNRNTQKLSEVTLKAVNEELLNSSIKTYLPSKKQDIDNHFVELNPDYAFLKLNTFSYRDPKSVADFQNFIDRFFKTVNDRKIDNLILDLRNNGGGDINCAAYLYSFLISKSLPFLTPNSSIGTSDLKLNQVEPAQNHFNGNLYVLINGGSFSSTGLLISLLKYNHIGRFIGEESGGSYITAANKFQRDIEFPNTKLCINKIVKTVETAVSGLTPGRGIFPDFEVKPTISDYCADRDVEMEFVRQLMKPKRSLEREKKL